MSFKKITFNIKKIFLMRYSMHNKKVLDEFLQSELTHVTSTQVEKGNISRTPKSSLVSPSHQ